MSHEHAPLSSGHAALCWEKRLLALRCLCCLAVAMDTYKGPQSRREAAAHGFSQQIMARLGMCAVPVYSLTRSIRACYPCCMLRGGQLLQTKELTVTANTQALRSYGRCIPLDEAYGSQICGAPGKVTQPAFAAFIRVLCPPHRRRCSPPSATPASCNMIHRKVSMQAAKCLPPARHP
jgi:hypothetical protein